MGWFSPYPLELKFGEPAHLLVARALYSDAVKVCGDIIKNVDYHFVGPHGIEYKGTKETWDGTARCIALLCEEVQQDFNERIAAMNTARGMVRKSFDVPSLFGSVKKDEA